MGQAQHKAACYLIGLKQAAGQVVEAAVVHDQVQHTGEQGGVQIRLEQAFALLLDAFGNRALAEAVAAGNVKGRHQRFAVDEREKCGKRKPIAELQRVKFGRVGQNDGDHAGALEQVEHANGVYGAGFGALHEKGSFLAPLCLAQC